METAGTKASRSGGIPGIGAPLGVTAGKRLVGVLVALALGCTGGSPPVTPSPVATPGTTVLPDSLPGFLRLLQRNQIPAIRRPVVVPASEARIPESAWVIGVDLDGEARAYSINLLNQHEIVNDRIAGTAIAATW